MPHISTQRSDFAADNQGKIGVATGFKNDRTRSIQTIGQDRHAIFQSRHNRENRANIFVGTGYLNIGNPSTIRFARN